MKEDPALLVQLEQLALTYLSDFETLARRGEGPAPLGAIKGTLLDILGPDFTSPGRFYAFRSPNALVLVLTPAEGGDTEFHILSASAVQNADGAGVFVVGQAMRDFWSAFMSANRHLHPTARVQIPSVVQLRQAVVDALSGPPTAPAVFEEDQLLLVAAPLADPQRKARLILIPHVSVTLLAPFPPPTPFETHASNEPETTHPSRRKDAARKARRPRLFVNG